MTADIVQVRFDLRAEQQSLDLLLSELTGSQWCLPTPAAGWTVSDQVGHLAYFDRTAALAIVDPDSFAEEAERLRSALATPDPERTLDDLTLGEFRQKSYQDLLAGWQQASQTLHQVASRLENDSRVKWYGPSMGSKTFLTARLMETWVHGHDIEQAVGVSRPASDRLRHIARLGFITRSWSFLNRGLPPPQDPVWVQLTGPAGQVWEFGPDEASERVVGPAQDFCLVVTQRRHVDDTALVSTPLAYDWLLQAQAFAGPPTQGPPPRS